jgi:conserved repeat domain/conserved repeat domain
MSNKGGRFLRFFFVICVLTGFGGATAWAAGPWFVSNAGNDGSSCLSPGAACLTINGAIGKASAGDTINVAAGTYNESVSVTKTLTLHGAQAGVDARTRSAAESVINNTCGPVQIRADNVVLDGFTVQGSTQSDPCFLAGIWTNPGQTGTQGGHQILNNIVQNNISGIELDSTCVNSTLVQFNLLQNNNNSGPASGNAIQTNFGLCKATIDSNKFTGHTNASILINAGIGGGDQLIVSNNELVGSPTTTERIVLGGVTNSSITGNTSIGSTATNGPIRLFFGNNNITINSNVLRNGIRGIKVDDIVGGFPNTNISARLNCIEGNSVAGLEVATGGHSGTLNADLNWWGSATGPTIASNPSGTGDAIIDPDAVVVYIPFLGAPAAACAATAADLIITKSHSGTFRQGDIGDTYTITVSNPGPGATSGAGGVTVSDTLPAGLTPTAPNGVAGGWNCSIVGQTVTCNRSDVLASGGSYPAITLTVNVTNNAAPNVTNTATVSGGGETNTANDSFSDPTAVIQVADISITKTVVGAPPYAAGANRTYTITVVNNGGSAATGVTVSDTLPAGTTFVSATPSQGSCSGTATVSCALGGLVSGGSATISLVLTTSSTPGVVSNTATVTAAQLDTNLNNNTSTSTITTIPASQIPAISGWALIALAAMLVLLGAMKIRS